MGLAFKTNVHKTIANSTSPEQSISGAGTQRKGWPWRVCGMLTFYPWLRGVTGHTGQAEWSPNEVGLQSKAGKLKTWCRRKWGTLRGLGTREGWEEDSVSGWKLISQHSGEHVCVSMRPGQPA